MRLDFACSQTSIIYGDSLSISIAAARWLPRSIATAACANWIVNIRSTAWRPTRAIARRSTSRRWPRMGQVHCIAEAFVRSPRIACPGIKVAPKQCRKGSKVSTREPEDTANPYNRQGPEGRQLNVSPPRLVLGYLFWVFFVKTPHRIVILSGAPHRSIGYKAFCGAESKDLGGAYSYPCCSELFDHRGPTTGSAAICT